MAEENTNPGGGANDEVTFDADAKLEADASTGQGPAAIDFEADDALGAEPAAPAAALSPRAA